MSKHSETAQHIAIVVVLLLLQLFLRVHSNTTQQGYVDEGFHNQRAAVVWQFQVNPGSFSNGKLLTYFWLGLFEGDHSTALFVSRTAIA